jgi:cation:H+ antiporter
MASFGIELIIMLVIILVAAEIFTNALEHFGDRLGISEGVTGSVFAAVGTALPETMVPVLAIFSGTNNHLTNEQIGVGAILGAPLMLSTLTIFLMAVVAFKSRGLHGRITPELSGFIRDMNFFICAFLLAAAAMFVPHEHLLIRGIFSILLVSLYVAYLALTFKASGKLVEDGHGTAAGNSMFFNRFGMKDNNFTVIFQLIIGLVLLILGAKGFIHGVEAVSPIINISPLILSLLIIPIATELPEKINSMLWVKRGKDTMAFGNITGAMVFQGSLLPAIGILLTPWQPHKDVIPGVIITLIAAFWLRFNAAKNGLSVMALSVCGVLYAAYLFFILHYR